MLAHWQPVFSGRVRAPFSFFHYSQNSPISARSKAAQSISPAFSPQPSSLTSVGSFWKNDVCFHASNNFLSQLASGLLKEFFTLLLQMLGFQDRTKSIYFVPLLKLLFTLALCPLALCAMEAQWD